MLINVNGQSYQRWEDVPEDVRRQLAATLPDADKNGVPDLLEGNLSGLPTGGRASFTSVSVNGQPVTSVGQLPPEVQELLRSALGMVPPAPGAPAAPTNAAAPLPPDQVVLNGVPTTVGDEPARKPWWKRLFG